MVASHQSYNSVVKFIVKKKKAFNAIYPEMTLPFTVDMAVNILCIF